MNILNQKLAEQKTIPQIEPQKTNIVVNNSVPPQIDKKKLAVSVAAGISIAAIVVGGLAYKRKIDSKTIKQLAENIEFKNCETLDDAIKFGKEHLGIKQYKGFKKADLDVVNWINQGLVNVNNVSKGKATMPKKIKYSNLDSCAGSMNSYGTLSISRTQIEETKEAIKEFLNKTTNEETAKEFIQKLNKKK